MSLHGSLDECPCGVARLDCDYHKPERRKWRLGFTAFNTDTGEYEYFPPY